VEIAKRRRGRAAIDSPRDQLSHVAALLHGHLRDARERLPALLEVRHVPDHEDARLSRDGHIRLDLHPSASIARRAEPFGGRRWLDAGGQDPGPAADALASEYHALRVARVHWPAGAVLDSRRGEPGGRLPRERLGEARKDARPALHEDDARRRRV